MDYKEKNKEFFSLYFIISTEKTPIDYKEKKLVTILLEKN